jgi:membrane-bound metal-dependent hydrolase YbcI (DUF457 family)
MPSPIAHLSVGYAIYRYYKERLPEAQIRVWKLPSQLIVVAGLSLLPDLDVIPGVLFKDMHRFHNNLSHSVFVAIPVSLLVAGVFQRAYRSNFWLWFLICMISYDLHILADAMTAGRGVMMFWPLTDVRFASPVKFFYGLQWGLGWFRLEHLWTILTECLFGLIVISGVNYFEKRRRATSQ